MQTYRRVLRPFDKNSGPACSAQAFDTAPRIDAFYQEIYNGAYTSTLRLRSGQASSAQVLRLRSAQVLRLRSAQAQRTAFL